jgi:hypothetical protein
MIVIDSAVDWAVIQSGSYLRRALAFVEMCGLLA